MNANTNILVVLSAALLRHLRRVAEEQQIPLRWLVAGLVCDTFETGTGHGKLTCESGES